MTFFFEAREFLPLLHFFLLFIAHMGFYKFPSFPRFASG